MNVLPVSDQADTCLVCTHHGHSSSGQPGSQRPTRSRAPLPCPVRGAEERDQAAREAHPQADAPLPQTAGPGEGGADQAGAGTGVVLCTGTPRTSWQLPPRFSKAALLPAVLR